LSDIEQKAQKERMKEYRRRYEERHGIVHRKYHWRRWVAAAVLVCLAGTGGFFFAQTKTVQAVLLDGQPVEGMTADDIEAYLDKNESTMQKQELLLQGDDINEKLVLNTIGCTYDRDRIDDEIYLIGRTGTPWQRVADVYTTLRYGKNVALAIKADPDKLADYVEKLRKDNDVPEENAYAEPDGSSVTIHKEINHIVIDADSLQGHIKDTLASGTLDPVAVPITDRRDAQIKRSDLAGIDTVLSSYTTHFDSTNPDRNKNIDICQGILTHSIVKAGETFSFNDSVGTRTRDKGYKDAPVYFDNKVVLDAGGGVCQVSTTLFNAVLRAGLMISSRSPHFAPAGYVPVGMDATVADNSLDFSFTNPFKHPVYIYTKYSSNSITVYVLGNKADTCTVQFETLSQKTLPHKIVRKHDDSVSEDVRDQEGYDGHDIKIRRKVKYTDGDSYTDTIVSHYDPNTEIIKTAGPSSEETVQTSNLEGEFSQDYMINELHDPTKAVAPDEPVLVGPAGEQR
jgi:vancomycin resistance protein YoaR